MKKIYCMLMAICLALSLTGCTQGEMQPTPTPTLRPTFTPMPSIETDDLLDPLGLAADQVIGMTEEELVEKYKGTSIVLRRYTDDDTLLKYEYSVRLSNWDVVAHASIHIDPESKLVNAVAYIYDFGGIPRFERTAIEVAKQYIEETGVTSIKIRRGKAGRLQLNTLEEGFFLEHAQEDDGYYDLLVVSGFNDPESMSNPELLLKAHGWLDQLTIAIRVLYQ